MVGTHYIELALTVGLGVAGYFIRSILERLQKLESSISTHDKDIMLLHQKLLDKLDLIKNEILLGIERRENEKLTK